MNFPSPNSPMDAFAPTKPFSPFFILLLLLYLFGFFLSAADNTDLVYKGCADQKFQDPAGVYPQNLKSLLASLVSQSGQKGFSSTTSGDGQTAIMGLYQCRGDLKNSDCYDCVSKITGMLNKLCGSVLAARVQLNGCYFKYEISGFKQVPDTVLLYKVCGSSGVREAGFEERRDAALEMVLNGVKSGGNLFYTGSYESVYVLGQCEEDMVGDECGNCVKSAQEKAIAECGDSFSAQVYLNKCYISYRYYPNGVPSISSSSPGHQHTQRTVAIAVGGFAALGFLVVCLLFLNSLTKKRGGKY